MKYAAILMCLAGSAHAQDLGVRPEFEAASEAQIALGQLLFYDPILSGNRSVSCATCHHPRLGTSDGMSLSIGDGGIGLGPDRHMDPDNPPEQRIGRNAPALFNLGADEFQVMFHDGRLEADPSQPGGMRTPLGAEMIAGFDSVLSAQAMFPVLSSDEMAGHYSENEIAQAVRLGHLSLQDGAWDLIALRVAQIPAYRDAFADINGAQNPVTFTDISNVVADFIAAEWRADDAPFDRYMISGTPMGAAAMRGMDLFYGQAQCADCHSGWLQTDHDFHAIAMPQIGPGKAARFENHNRDVGRMRVTGDAADAYRFRTPSLRNVTLTGPYGHDGAYATLDAVVRHHLDPVASLMAYDRNQAVLHDFSGAQDWNVLDDPQEMAAIAAANELAPIDLSASEIADLLAFLAALTDPVERMGVPETVPSGLPVDR
ncbi:cytochrome-c peroxidase [Aestuariibius sp. HNIBRBA575]|uniref:cytochrome-c peroxidase n=1 Tax=Aestuariibius sp. HNIBRBA575 TaxID=3233343 RepID=UPI0034A5AA30